MAKDAPRKVPAIRFKGFTEDWKESKVSDYSESTFGGGTPKTDVEEYWNGELPWIQSSDLREYQVCAVHARKRITKLGVEKSATKLVPANSIAVVTRVGVGKLALMPFEYSTSQDFLSFSHLKVNGLFGVYSLYTKLQRDLHAVQGTSIKGITKKELLNKKIRIPISLDEQAKIGSFLKKLDTTIILRQRKLDKLQKLKSAYLTEMFPSKGACKPKRRFNGFDGDWEYYELGKVSQINPKSSIPNRFKYVDLGSVVGTNLISSRNVMKKHAPSRAQRLAKTGDIFYQTVRPYQKNNYHFALREGDYVFSTGYAQIRSKVDSLFLMAQLQTKDFVQTVLDQSTGTSYPAISPKSLSKIRVFIPNSREEQEKVGKFFSYIDRVTTHHKHKINDLKKLKNGLLNNLFV